MFCKNCGTKLADGVNFCSACGTRMNSVPENSGAPYVLHKTPSSVIQSTQPQQEINNHVCPNCGANITNTHNCEFCGSLLVRFAEIGINIDDAKEYTSDALVFKGMQEELDKHLTYKKNNPNEYVQTNINDNLLVVISTKSLTDFDGRAFFENAEIDGLGICIWFKRESEDAVLQLERFKELKSFSLFTHRITRRKELVGINKDDEEIYSVFTYDEYAIDFGLDSKSAARFCSEILAHVYNLPQNTILNYFTELQSEKEKKIAKLKEDMDSSESVYKICLGLLILVGIAHIYFYFSDGDMAAMMTWVCLVPECILSVIEEKNRKTYNECKLALNA